MLNLSTMVARSRFVTKPGGADGRFGDYTSMDWANFTVVCGRKHKVH